MPRGISALLLLLLLLAVSNAVPAVYYKLWFVVDNNSIATCDAQGNGFTRVYTSLKHISDSIAFNGTGLFVIEDRASLLFLDLQSTPTVRHVVFSTIGLACFALGTDTGASVIFSATANGTLYRTSLDGRVSTTLASVNQGGECRQMTFSRPSWLFWTTAEGVLFKFNTAKTDSPRLQQRLGAANSGIATASSSNLLLYASNFNSIRSQTLSVVQETDSGSVADSVWMTTAPFNRTRSLVTLNGAIVVSGNGGIGFIFNPFQTSGLQFVARTILSTYTGISGICTNGSSAISAAVAIIGALLSFALMG